MSDGGDHVALVDAWLESTAPTARAAANGSPPDLGPLLEASTGSIIRRARTTLGEITLGAIVDRVLFHAAGQFPVLAPLGVGVTAEIDWQEFRARPVSKEEPSLRPAMRFLLIELLTVIGKLTAEVLTPELHWELSTVAVPPPDARSTAAAKAKAPLRGTSDEEKGS